MASNLPYDSSRQRQQVLHAPSATGLSIAGTNAADAVLLRIPLAVDSVKLNYLRVRMTTGGTAAGPAITIGKSLAGTGAVTAIGTLTFGTSANGAVANASLTNTEFDAGDEVVVSVLAGTAASTPVIVFALGYREV